MKHARASQTALATSIMRALHTRFDRPPLIHDDWGERLVLPAERDAFVTRAFAVLSADQRSRLEALASSEAILYTLLRNRPIYASVILRTRYTEEALKAAVARGVRQYVILGAGMDSFGLRQPDFAHNVDVYEVDHPAGQERKLARMRDSGVTIPPTLRYVPADLAHEDLRTALSRSTFRFDEPAFFSWLGVTVYLTREANEVTLRSIAECGAPGSELVFTYVDERALKSESAAMQNMKTVAAELGEPWLTGFDPATLREDLARAGLELVEDLDGRQIHDRYASLGGDGLNPGYSGHMARARRSN